MGAPVIVELVAAVVEAGAIGPPDRLQLLARQRLGHQHMVVDRHDVAPHLANGLGPRVGGDDDPVGDDGVRSGADSKAPVGVVDALDPGAVVDDASERLDGIGEPPDESSGIEQSERVVVREPAVERGGVDPCLRSGLIHQGVSESVLSKRLGFLGEVIELPPGGGEGDFVGSVGVAGDCVAIDRGEQVVEIVASEAFKGVEVIRPVSEAVEHTVGETHVGEPAVAGGGSETAGLCFEHDHATSGLLLECLKSGPEAGEATTNDAEVGADTASQRWPGIGRVGLIRPVDGRTRLGDQTCEIHVVTT